MKFFPASCLQQLEFDEIKHRLASHCNTEYAKSGAQHLRIHTKIEFVESALTRASEYKSLLEGGISFPNEFYINLSRELKLLSIPGATLSGEEFLLILRLAQNAGNIFRWFDNERKTQYPALATVTGSGFYEKAIRNKIDAIVDPSGIIKDNASTDLTRIRADLYRKRNDLRRVFDRMVDKLNKLGYLADIEESFMNGRRVLAVVAEQKRMVKGVLHADSDSRKTSFIEPEETIGLNNELFSLEHEERSEAQRILRSLTAELSVYAPLLQSYLEIAGEFDLIQAKARMAIETGGHYPVVKDKAHLRLIDASHPLLLLYNKKLGKPTVPLTLTLEDSSRILVISGPNAGGKTVTLKTVALLQVMLQAGLLVPVSPDSEMGIFKQLMIHIGDTQSIEFELSTYSSHLKNMKHFIENANGKTLFFIDELGSGSDPNLGGAFAEVIMEELAHRHAYGIVTTHYLNLKVMANKVPGIINGAMQFDEKNLLPLYKLRIGQPGSSYTFAIAERIGLDQKLITKARKLVDESHFQLDKLLNTTEQDMQDINRERSRLQKLINENELLRNEMESLVGKENHARELQVIKEQNRISADKIAWMRDMERKLKAMIVEWRKADDKKSVVKMIQALLFDQKDKFKSEKQQKKLNEKYVETGEEIKPGVKVKMKNNRTVGVVKELRGKKAILQVGSVPITVNVKDLVVVTDV